MRLLRRTLVLVALLAVALGAWRPAHAQDPSLRLLGTYETNVFDEGAAEIATFDAARDRVFFVNADAGTVDVLNLDASATASLFTSIDVNALAEAGATGFTAGGANSIAAAGDLLAVAVEADPQTDPGVLVFIDLTADLTNLPGSAVTVVDAGALPDGVGFTPDGTKLIAANEGEPDGGIDPEGSITVVDVTATPFAVTQIAFSGLTPSTIPADVRIFGNEDNPNPTVAEDLEPEYVTATNTTAYVTIQENNALAVVDLSDNSFQILALGFKDHGQPGNGLDASDRDGGINITPYDNVFGMYQPDAISVIDIGGEPVLVTANEGDARDFEEDRVEDLVLDPAAFPDATLQDPDQLGRLEITTTLGLSTSSTVGVFAELEGGQQEPDPVTTEAEGFARMTFDPATGVLAYTVVVEGLDFGAYLDGTPRTADTGDDVTLMHIHNAPAGSNGGVVFGVIGPANDADATFREDSEGRTVISGTWSPNEGSSDAADFPFATTPVDDELDLYWNIHTEEFGGGEIRGQLEAANVYDELYAYGARSFTTWDGASGALLADSEDAIEQRLAALLPDYFNSDNDENDSADSRSDAKGPEPEAVAVGTVGGTPYAFVGLERVGGVMVFDLTTPTDPQFVDYLNNRNFLVEDVQAAIEEGPKSGTAGAVGDLGPESITFVPGADSPTGETLLIVSNEVSGTVSFYGFGAPSAYTLQLLHASDLESPTSGVGLGDPNDIGDIPRFSALVSTFRDQYANTLLLSSGDNVLPTPLFTAGGDGSLDPILGDASAGRADIAFMNFIGFDGSTIGNHEFDQGTDRLASLLETDDGYPGTRFPYLSANLDFGPNGDLSGFAVPAGGAPVTNSLTPSVVYDVGGEAIGVVGVTTPELATISSPGNVVITPPDFDPNDAGDIAALADLVQAEVDAITATGVNKVIAVMHLQEFNIDRAVIEQLEDVDVVISGGSDRLLADADDVLRSGDTAEDTYPLLIADATGNDVVVVSTDGKYTYLGRLVVTFDDAGVVTGTGPASEQGAYATTTARVEAVTGETEADLIADGTIDADVLDLAAGLKTVLEGQLANTFGVTDVFINGLRGEVRTEETNLGNLSADANLAYARAAASALSLPDYADVDVSLKNGGGIRAPIGEIDADTGDRVPPQAIPGVRAEGEISQLEIGSSLAFDNGLTLLTLTPAQFKEALENGVSRVEDVSGRFPQIAGFTLGYDLSRLPGDRVRAVTLDDGTPIVTDGAVVGGAPDVRLVTLSFLAGGGDGYAVFTQAAAPVDLTSAAGLPDDLLGATDGVVGLGDRGGEQDAFSEFAAATFPAGAPFAEADTPVESDGRIVNLTAQAGVAGVPAWINELHYDNDGTDVGEFVEVAVRAGASPADLAAIEVVLYNGNGGGSYDTRTLDTFTEGATDPSGNFTLYVLDYTADGGSIQNGAPDGLALCSGGTVIGNGDPVTRQFLSYEGTFTAVGGCADGLTSTDIGVEESSSTQPGESLGLAGNGSTYADLVSDGWQVIADDTPGAVNPAQVLPVELAAFEALADGEFATLTWTTAAETNNAGFVVEHRRPGATAFTEAAFVDGAGTTTEAQAYRARVKVAELGTHVFRLRQVDFDGTPTLSREVEVDSRLRGPYRLSAAYPNPVAGARATLDLAVRETQQVTVALYDVLGRRVATVFDGEVAGSQPQVVRVAAQGLASGVYFVRVTGERFRATRRMTVVR